MYPSTEPRQTEITPRVLLNSCRMVLYIGGNTTVQYLGNILVCCLGNELPVYVHEGENGHILATSFSTLRLLVLTCTCCIHTCTCTVVNALIWWGVQNMDTTWPCAGTYFYHIHFKWYIVVSRATLDAICSMEQ